MAREVEVVTIQELLNAGAIVGHKDGNYGSQYPRVEEFGSVGVPFLTAKSLDDGRVDIAGAPRLADERANELRFGFIRPGDVLLSHNATVGRVAVVPEFSGRMLIGTSLTYFRLNPERILPRYLAAYFRGKAFQDELAAVMSHSTRNQVPITAQRLLRISLPALPVQRAIAHVLGTFDDKIELNRRMNETLEAVARTIFQSWFVDFDPVRAKASGEPPESICRRLGLAPELLALFPDRLVDSELGEIPEGWEVKALAQVTSYLNRGLSPKYVETGGVLVVNQKCVRDGRVATSKARQHDPAQRSVAGRLVEVGDVLVNSTGVGTLGRVAQVLAIDEPMIVDSHVTVVRADPAQVSWNFLGVAMQERESDIEALGEGSTGQTELSRVRLGGLRLVMPPKPLCNYFDEVVRPLRLHTKRNDEQNDTLASIRDALLPKLLSGELRVPSEAVACP